MDNGQFLSSNKDNALDDSSRIFQAAANVESFVYVPYTNQINDVADKMRELYELLFNAVQEYASILESDANGIYRLATDFEEFDKWIKEQEEQEEG